MPVGHITAPHITYALNRVGCPTVQINGLGGSIAEQASIAREGHLLLAISFPPYASDTLQVCQQLRERGVKRLALTNSIFSPIAKMLTWCSKLTTRSCWGFARCAAR